MNTDLFDNESFVNVVRHNWGVLALRAIAAIIFGILALVWPGITLLVLVYLFGIYAIINGILTFAMVFKSPTGAPVFCNYILPVIVGLVSILTGIFVLCLPGLTALTVIFMIGLWAVITGILEIIASIRFRKVVTNDWLYFLGGLVTLILGLFLLAHPAVGLLALIYWIGAFAIVYGILFLILALRVRPKV